MKKIKPILIFCLLFSMSLTAQNKGKTRSLKPIDYRKRVSTLINGKLRNYYSLNDEKASTIIAQGPGVLRVITRARFVPNQEKEIDYEINYILDGSETENVESGSVLRSKKATYVNESIGIPAQMRDFEIKLDRGYHTIQFYIKDKGFPVAARYLFYRTKSKKIDWIAFSPLQPSEPVNLISRESTVKYYRFSTEKPLKLEINGPTQLRVLTRIENHYKMKGRIDYRLEIKENEKLISTYQLSSKRSEIATYESDKKLIPGKACEFVINVPKGRHAYEVAPLDKDKNSILGRCLLPEKDVKLKK